MFSKIARIVVAIASIIALFALVADYAPVFAKPTGKGWATCKSVCFARTGSGKINWTAIRKDPRGAIMVNPQRVQIGTTYRTLFKGRFSTLGGRYYWARSDFDGI